MSQVEEFEGQMKELSSHEFQELSTWLAEYDSEVWDRQIRADALAGRLDGIPDQALRDFSQGRSTEL